MPTAIPEVRLTELLRQNLAYDPEAFAQYFAQWKASGPGGEHADWFFGKDSAFARPKRNGRMVLRHVHLPPPEGTPARRLWDTVHARPQGGRKTSDIFLVYAYEVSRGYLLIYITPNPPGGHDLADMSTPETAALMSDLADVAEAFLHDGSVVI